MIVVNICSGEKKGKPFLFKQILIGSVSGFSAFGCPSNFFLACLFSQKPLGSIKFTNLHFVAHSVDLLDVGEDHLGIDAVVGHHRVHVVSGQEVRNSGVASERKL
jgi:hypothetical protein